MLLACMLLLYLLVNLRLLWNGKKWIERLSLPPYRMIAGGFILLYFLFTLLPAAAAFLHPHAARRIMICCGNLWLGYCFYLFLCCLPGEVLRALPHRRRRRSPGRHTVQSFWAGILILSLSASLTLGGWYHARQMKTVSYSLTIPQSAGQLSSLKIAFAADLHLGCQIGCREMRGMVQRINQMNPDLVLLGGDIFDSSYEDVDQPEALISILQGIRSRFGVYAVYGNHDVTETLIGGFAVSSKSHAFRDSRMRDFLTQCGIHMLEDEGVVIGSSVCLLGRLDGEKAGDGTANRASVPQLMAQAEDTMPVLVLEHEPVELQELAQAGADLILSGHTHAGQFFPLTLAQKLIWDNPYGLRQFGDTYSIVTSGVGLYGPPLRVLTDSEVAEITLRFQPPTQ